MTENEKFLIVTTMKNEGPFMLDWIAYNRAIGFSDILIYTNDCSDGTDIIGDRLQELGFAYHERNRLGPRKTPQNRAHELSMKHPCFQNADWIMSLDVDEYINIRLPEKNIQAFVNKCGPSDAISICWKMFGNSDLHTYEDIPIPELLLNGLEENNFPHYKTRAFKTLFRNNGKFNRFRAHRPRIDPEFSQTPDTPYKNILWRDAGGQKTDAEQINWKRWKRFSDKYARIHHYALRTTDSFLVKRDRGRTNHTGQDQGLDYWNQFNYNNVIDDSILQHMPAMHVIKNKMMADPQLKKLHNDACTWHRQKVKELKKRPEWADFITRLYTPHQKEKE